MTSNAPRTAASRLGVGATGAAIAIVAAAVTLYAAFFAGSRACGDQMQPAPQAGSPRASYCGLFGDPDPTRLLFEAAVGYSPVWLVVVGTAAAVLRRRWWPLWASCALSGALLVLMAVLAVTLPST